MNEKRRRRPRRYGGGKRARSRIYRRYGEDITKGADRVPVVIGGVHERRRRRRCGGRRRWKNHAAARRTQLGHRRQIDAVLREIQRAGDTDRTYPARGGVTDTNDGNADARRRLRREIEAEDPSLLGRGRVNGLKEPALAEYRLPTARVNNEGRAKSRHTEV